MRPSTGQEHPRLPPVPPCGCVTAAVGTPDLVWLGVQLATLGYRFVGVRCLHDGHVVELVVPAGLAVTHPRWWRQVTARARGVSSARFGPVRSLYANLLALHQRMCG